MAQENASDLIMSSLQELGGPAITHDDISRLNNGALGEVLVFLSKHMRGRQATLEVRQAIAAQGLKNRLPREGTTELERQILQKRVHSANAGVEQLYRQSDELERSIHDAQKEITALECALESQRQGSLLLSVLHRKESVRVERINALTNSLEDARSHIPDAKGFIQGSSIELSSERPLRRSVRATATRDTLAAIQALHLQIVTLTQSKTAWDGTSEIEKRLENAIARKLSLSVDDERVQATLEEIRQLSKDRALNCLSIQTKGSDAVGDNTLKAAISRVDAKEQSLRSTAERLATLQASCSECLQAISIYHEASVPTLKESLEENLLAAQGYIDTLRSSIELYLARKDGGKASEPVSMGPKITEDKLRNDIMEAHELQRFLQSATIKTGPIPPHVLDVIQSFMATDADVNNRAEELLRRKNAKKESVGDVLVEDIERLKKEVDMLVNGVL